MKTTKTIETLLQEKRETMEALNWIMEQIAWKEKDCTGIWDKTGNKVRKKHWGKDIKDYEYDYDENGDPIMVDEYDTIYVDINDDRIDERNRMLYNGLQRIKDKMCELL